MVIPKNRLGSRPELAALKLFLCYNYLPIMPRSKLNQKPSNLDLDAMALTTNGHFHVLLQFKLLKMMSQHLLETCT